MSDFKADHLHNLHERRQRLRDYVHRLQDQFDRETRLEEQMRLEPMIAGKKHAIAALEDEIRQLEPGGSAPPAPASAPVEPGSADHGGPPRLFYSYAHKDEALRDELAVFLKPLERENLISTWHDRDIAPGAEWNKDIRNRLRSADVVLLLVSAAFLASDYIWSEELKVALERHDRGEARVIPIILRPCDWASAPFSRLQALPREAKPVSQWDDSDEAFTDIAIALRRVVEKMAS